MSVFIPLEVDRDRVVTVCGTNHMFRLYAHIMFRFVLIAVATSNGIHSRFIIYELFKKANSGASLRRVGRRDAKEFGSLLVEG